MASHIMLVYTVSRSKHFIKRFSKHSIIEMFSGSSTSETLWQRLWHNIHYNTTENNQASIIDSSKAEI